MNTHPSQSQRILACLRDNWPSWVAMPVLVEVSGAYAVHSRISELRKQGHKIPPARVERHGGVKRSFYRLLK